MVPNCSQFILDHPHFSIATSALGDETSYDHSQIHKLILIQPYTHTRAYLTTTTTIVTYHGDRDCGPLLPRPPSLRHFATTLCSETCAISFLVQCGARWTYEGLNNLDSRIGPSSSSGPCDPSATEPFGPQSLSLSRAKRACMAWHLLNLHLPRITFRGRFTLTA